MNKEEKNVQAESVIVYNKLVRDKIPMIIEADQKSCEVRVLDKDAFKEALNQKLQEEANEWLESGDVEELADLLEVIRALGRLHGHTMDQLIGIMEEKKEKRGGFDQRLFLTNVITPKQ